MPWFRNKQTGHVMSAAEDSQRASVLRHSAQYDEVDLGQLASPAGPQPPEAGPTYEDWSQGPADRDRLEDEPKAVLLTYAANRGLHDVKSHWTKVEIIDALMESE